MLSIIAPSCPSVADVLSTNTCIYFLIISLAALVETFVIISSLSLYNWICWFLESPCFNLLNIVRIFALTVSNNSLTLAIDSFNVLILLDVFITNDSLWLTLAMLLLTLLSSLGLLPCWDCDSTFIFLFCSRLSCCSWIRSSVLELFISNNVILMLSVGSLKNKVLFLWLIFKWRHLLVSPDLTETVFVIIEYVLLSLNNFMKKLH